MHLHFPWISHEASLRAQRSNPGDKIADKPLVFRDDMRQAGCTKSCHRALVARSMDCFVVLPRIIRVVAGVPSGSNLRAGTLRATAPFRKSDLAMTEMRFFGLRPLNDVWCHPELVSGSYYLRNLRIYSNSFPGLLR